MKKIYLARHGESTSNVTSVVQGGSDELTEKGRAQAATLAERLKHLEFQNLVVSDYVRTRQTAEPLLSHTNVAPNYCELVREVRRPKSIVGLPIGGPEYTNYHTLSELHINEPEWHFEDEENYFDTVARVREFFALIETLEGDTVVITHGRFIIYAVMYVLLSGHLTPDRWDSDFATFTTTNTGITVLSFNEHSTQWALTTYNDHAHFAE